MPKTMLINVTHAEESRVGIVADNVLASFEIETLSREHLKGNIYKGVVHRIHPALEAAFVDIGAERDAFLPLDEICFRNLPRPPRDAGNGAEGRRRRRIKEVLAPGEEVVVQIVKEEFGSKPPTLSTFYSLPGRYLVLLPGSDEAGISRKIEGTERTRIRELIEKLQPPPGFGIIVRTAAGFDQGARELHRDLTYLLRLWETIQQAAAGRRGPALVYREHDLVLRTIRDYFTPDIDEIYIDNEEVFQRARDFLRDVMPGKEDVLHFYQGDQPIFSHFNLESQIESIYKRRVPLPSGGSIVIDGTEALTAIDVNSGRSVRGSNQEETAVRTNVEAAVEIARQLRLRDIGGLIVIDFIDMRNAQHVAEVERTLREAMHPEKARHDVGRISHFGLLEVSRQRLRPAAAATTYTACPMCEGHGLVRTTESAALVALRKIHNRVAQGDAASVRVSLPPDVAVYVLNQKREDVAQLERRYATRIHIVLNPGLMPHQSELEVRTRVEAGKPELPQIRLGGVAAGAEAASPNNGAAAAAAPAIDAQGAPEQPKKGRRRRRRGRRRGRGRQAAAAIGEGLAALGAHTSLAVVETPAIAPAPPAIEPTDTPPGATGRVIDDDRSEAPEVPAQPNGGELPGAEPAMAMAPPKGKKRQPTRGRRSRTGGAGRTQRKARSAATDTPKVPAVSPDETSARAAPIAEAKAPPKRRRRTPRPGGAPPRRPRAKSEVAGRRTKPRNAAPGEDR